MKNFIFILLMFLVSCLKSTEDIRREKLVDTLDTQMQQSQTMMIDLTGKIKDFEQRVATVGGQIETIEHNQKQSIDQKLNQLTLLNEDLLKRIKNIEDRMSEQDKTIAAINEKVEEQNSYVKKVSKTLGSIAKENVDSTKTDLNNALKLVDQKKFKDAKPKLQELLSAKLSAGDNNKVYHGLGLVSLNEKKYEDAIVFFSKIYTKWPKSSLASSSLFHIGKSFAGQGKNEEAKQIYEELKNKYPTSSWAKVGVEEIKKL